MKIIPSLLIVMMPLLTSCIDVPTADNAASDTAASSATVDASSAAEVFGGYTMELNPTIVFSADGRTGTYNNSANDTGFPAGTNITVNITYGDGGVGLDITFTAQDPSVFGTEALGVIVKDFKDDGDDGYIDSFTVAEAKVGSTPIASFTSVVKTVAAGAMKRSEADIAKNSVEVPDITGAPTVDEWNKNVVGSAFLVEGNDGDLDLISFESATTGTMYGLSGEDKGEKETFTYSYSYDNQNEGVIFYKGEPYSAGTIYPTVGADTKIQWTADIDLKFTDWYNGTYAESQGKDTVVDTGDVIYQDTSPASGTFSVIKNVNVYIQENL